jgi:hypothetical protein
MENLSGRYKANSFEFIVFSVMPDHGKLSERGLVSRKKSVLEQEIGKWC